MSEWKDAVVGAYLHLQTRKEYRPNKHAATSSSTHNHPHNSACFLRANLLEFRDTEVFESLYKACTLRRSSPNKHQRTT